MPLPIGDWRINSSGVLGTLSIAKADTAGNVFGTLSSSGFKTPSVAVLGFWDELTAKLTFMASGAVSANNTRTYTGFLFPDKHRMPGIEGGSVSTLVGFYEDFTSATTDRIAFGWYAQIGQA
ncbi:MAG: hypothetical protein JO033_01095 [Acidobacteriaceae bacterium]|nr:hypothetical protein [Candidatus Eremiobacteraeota bacterium]MBV8807243.1 hypothetical protein [Acidobacteriaceae bacterium]